MASPKLANGLTLKQERFAQAYIANGGNASQAYRDAYDTQGNDATVWPDASRLLDNPKVIARIHALEQQALEANSLTPTYVLANLKRNAELARDLETPQMSASNHALELIGKHAGMWREQATTQYNVQVNLIEQLSRELSVEELKALRAQAIEASHEVRERTDADPHPD